MDLPSKKVYEILREKGVEEIHHANTVLTSTYFLRTGKLASRGTVETDKSLQTWQYSDDIDKKLGLWFDVFTDSVDIHERARQRNKYGPVLFVLDSLIIKEAYTGKIWITKSNPTKWGKNDEDQRWFSSLDELENDFKKGTFDNMIVFRHSGGQLPFGKYLKKIILDDPNVEISENKVDFFSMAFGALTSAMTLGSVKTKIEKRKCRTGCLCGKEYEDTDMAYRVFAPLLEEGS